MHLEHLRLKTEKQSNSQHKTIQILTIMIPQMSLTSLGIGEALVSALNEKGKPTPLAATMMRAPMSRMDILTESELGRAFRKI